MSGTHCCSEQNSVAKRMTWLKHRHRQHIGDGFALIAHLQRLAVVSDGWQEKGEFLKKRMERVARSVSIPQPSTRRKKRSANCFFDNQQLIFSFANDDIAMLNNTTCAKHNIAGSIKAFDSKLVFVLS
jgi:hypothetical protein